MKFKRLTYSHKICGIFACATAFICGVFIFSKGFPDLNVLVYGASIIFPAAFIAGASGFLIGKIFDDENKKGSAEQFFK